MVKAELRDILKSVLSELGIQDIQPQIERPADITHGDYSTNVALVAFKKYQAVRSKYQEFKTPLELAEDIIKRFKIQDSGFKNIEVAGAGFINFWLSEEELSKKLERLLCDDDLIADIGKGRRVVVEYSSPNIAKPFTVGHLRSTIIGDAMANLLETVGYKVFRDSHVGDWGTQFGKQIYAIKTWGNAKEIESSDRPVKALVDLYIKFHDEAEKNPELENEARGWFKKLEEGDAEAKRLWQKCIDWSWKEFDAIYKRLNVEFTENDGRGYGESYFENKMGSVISELKEKGFLKEGKEGALIVEFPKQTKLPPLMILKKDGATLYSTRDLATDRFRLEKYGSDVRIINEVGAEQSLYFQQLFKLEEMLGWYSLSQRVHVKHGLYRFKDEKMSTRIGNVIWLEEVLDEAIRRASALADKKTSEYSENSVNQKIRHSEISENQTFRNSESSEFSEKETAEKVAIGALKWNDLKRDPKQDIVFDWDDILNMEGNSGPYLQYTYARTQSVLRKAQSTSYKLRVTSYKLEHEEETLLRLLYFFSETVIEAAEKYSPNTLANYLFVLAQTFNLFYQKHQILNSESDTKDFRLALTSAVGKTTKKGLNLLGIEAPERM